MVLRDPFCQPYDEEVLELMSPRRQHENIGSLIGSLIGRMVETYTEMFSDNRCSVDQNSTGEPFLRWY